MSIEIKDDEYLVLLKYFKGDIVYLTVDKIKELKKSEFKGKQIKEIDKLIVKKFNDIVKVRTKKPEKYAAIQWIYPQWNEKEKEQKMKDYFPEDYEEEEETEQSEEDVKMSDQFIKPENGTFFTFEEQIDILINFYKKYDPKKTKEDIVGIINRRRPKGKPLGTRIPSEPWKILCERYKEKRVQKII